MSKQDYYEEVKEALDGDFLFGDVGEVMVEIADNLKVQRDALIEVLKACRLQLLQSNNDSEYAREACELAAAAIAKAEGNL